MSEYKKKQLNIILNNNPADDENHTYHTWIRTEKDILTYEEALSSEDYEEGQGLTPDFKDDDIKKVLNTGIIKVFSSYEIKPGIFVSPSKMEAQCYAGNNVVYEKICKLEDIAWIDPLQGQYAPVK